jgi:hypothetical protein
MEQEGRPAVLRDLVGERIEWTGAGGDYFLGIVVSQHDQVVDERWGTRGEVFAWMEMHWPQLPAKYVPMVRGSTGRCWKRSNEQPPLRVKKAGSGSA